MKVFSNILPAVRRCGLAALWALIVGTAGATSLGSAAGAQDAASSWVTYDQGRARLISATQNAAGNILLGLQYQIAPGWEVYWRSPGDAGFPTTIDWDGSDNLHEPLLRWPRPHRFEIFELETFGYKDGVVLPIEARQSRQGDDVAIRAAVNFLTCREICVPHTLAMSLDLPATGAESTVISEFAPLINAYRAQIPPRDGGGGMTVERAEIINANGGQLLQVVARSDAPFSTPDVFVEGPDAFSFAKPTFRLTENGHRAVLQMAVSKTALSGGDVPDLIGSDLTLTFVDGERAVERSLSTTLGQAEATAFLPFAAVLALALLGGLILNVMPCVLPVLSIKLLGVVSHGGGERGPVRRSFLASAAGIIFAFLVLAGILASFRAGGAAVGWGMQFQQPIFIVGMTVLITLFAANTWGLFEVRLPDWIAGSAGGGSGNPHSAGTSFASGVFATVLATPCSAPFLGTAIGFALARGSVEIFSIFLALGLGMAAPFLLVAAAPYLATRLPRPGRWMLVVKKVLAIALVATAAWLLSVLAFQVSFEAAYFLAAVMAVVIGVLFVGPRLPERMRPVATAVVLLMGFASFAAPQLGGAVSENAAVDDSIWRPFDPAAIPLLVADGKVVFVDVTAEWCITCQVNKKLVLTRGASRVLLSDPNVVAMRADWTNPDEGIARYLASFNRFGIPFNVIYGAVAPNGLVLPELLKESVVVDTFLQVSGRNLLADDS
jgi:suppressor for copper-sensitivity B